MRTTFSHYGAVGLVLLLAACSSGAQPSLVPSNGVANAATASGDTGTLVIRVRVPKPKTSHSLRGASYVSRSTEAMKIDFTGPSPVTEVFDLDVAAKPLPAGCAKAQGGFLCTEEVALNACSSKRDCYSGSIATYDAVSCGLTCHIPSSAKELSANDEVDFSVSRVVRTDLKLALDGIPTAVQVQRAAGSALAANGENFGVSKCETRRHPGLTVHGLDADGNTIVGSGEPTPALTSTDPTNLAIGTPARAAPDEFNVIFPPELKSATIPAANSNVSLTATETPLSGSGATKAVTTQVLVTFNSDVCGVVTDYPVPTASSEPIGITQGHDGAIWFTELLASQIGRLNPSPPPGSSSDPISEFPEPSQWEPIGILAGPRDQQWFTFENSSSNQGVGWITTAGEVYWSVPTPSAAPYGMTTYGDSLWFTESNANKIAVLLAGVITESATIPGSQNEPLGIAYGPDGGLWFTNYTGNSIGRLATGFSSGGGSFTITPIPTSVSEPYGIAAGPDGALWFTENGGNKIGRITTSGAITETPIPTSDAEPYDIVAGADGALWFTEGNGNKIGRITTTGSITEIPLKHANSVPWGITAASDGSLWFTENAADKIGRVQ
jgi:streptogramin lyase